MIRAATVGRTSSSLIVTRRGRVTAKAMISAVIAICSYIFSAACFASAEVMCSVSSVATAPGSMTMTRTSGCSS